MGPTPAKVGRSKAVERFYTQKSSTAQSLVQVALQSVGLARLGPGIGNSDGLESILEC